MPLSVVTMALISAFQVAPGTILTGAVRDGVSSEPVVGATVELVDIQRRARSDESGRYAFVDVPAGPQHIRVRLIGYSSRTIDVLVPERGRLILDIDLSAEAIPLPAVAVRSLPPIPNSPGGSLSFRPDRAASASQIRNRALMAEPDALVALTGLEVSAHPESPAGIHIRGGSSDQTGYLLDGIPVFSPYHAAGVFSAWNPDAISGVALYSSQPVPGQSDGLAGTIAANTRTPGEVLHLQGAASSTQARATLDGPLGGVGGFLISGRLGTHDLYAPNSERSYVGSGSKDVLGKVEIPTLGGLAKVLAYRNLNEVSSRSLLDGEDQEGGLQRNQFEWNSTSLGLDWSGLIEETPVRFLAWQAKGEAEARWNTTATDANLLNVRKDLGVQLTTTFGANRQGLRGTNSGQPIQVGSGTEFGARFVHSRTTHRTGEGLELAQGLDETLPQFTVFGQTVLRVRGQNSISGGADLSFAGGDTYFAPRVGIDLRLGQRTRLSLDVSRGYQFSQSLRNEESVVGAVFPAELFVGSANESVPVARGDQGVMALEIEVRPGAMLRASGYHKKSTGLALVSTSVGDPFSGGTFDVGSSRSSGLSVEGEINHARFSATAGYGWQRLRVRTAEVEYTPEFGHAHTLTLGLVSHLTASTTLQLGFLSNLGRHATPLEGDLEFESCNFLDQGCEFGGTPLHRAVDVGTLSLPSYSRVDLGIRKHWHISVGGADRSVGFFGTLTNLLGRDNVLNFVINEDSGERTPIFLRPFAPLVVGLEWTF